MTDDVFSELNEDNFILYAARNYNNPCCTDVDEFYTDVARFKYLKKLLKRYAEKGQLQERLILNHIIIIHNMFTIEAASRMCFYKIPESYWPALKTFMLYLNYIYDEDFINIPSDIYVALKLKEI
jgi:hypothetical protein